MGKSRFYGHISGVARTIATRQGNKESGIFSHTRGWNLGVSVWGRDKDGKDCFRVEITGGSNNAGKTVQVLEVFETEDGDIRIELENRDHALYDADLNPLVSFFYH